MKALRDCTTPAARIARRTIKYAMRNDSKPPATFPVRANARLVTLILVLIVGAVVGALAVYLSSKRKPHTPVAEVDSTLSESTLKVLRQLRQPVEVRFYSLFEKADSAAAWRTLAAEVNELLNHFESEAGGKLTLKRLTEWSAENTKRAAADGLVAQNLSQGEPIYLGVAVVQESRSEAIAQLAPEWAAALEFDLARVIARITHTAAPARSAEETAQIATAGETLKRLLPDAAATSLEDGRRIIQEATLAEFRAAVAELTSEVEKVEHRARGNITEAERQQALQELQAIRARHAEKLRDLGRKSQAELEAWNKLKGQ